mgnify:CR=1 FL=1
MALNGKLLLNGADIAPLTFPGVGVFMVFSGMELIKTEEGAGNILEMVQSPKGDTG